jgi:hypothetical protein
VVQQRGDRDGREGRPRDHHLRAQHVAYKLTLDAIEAKEKAREQVAPGKK